MKIKSFMSIFTIAIIVSGCINTIETSVVNNPTIDKIKWITASEEYLRFLPTDPDLVTFKSGAEVFQLSNSNIVVCGMLKYPLKNGQISDYTPYWARFENGRMDSVLYEVKARRPIDQNCDKLRLGKNIYISKGINS